MEGQPRSSNIFYKIFPPEGWTADPPRGERIKSQHGPGLIVFGRDCGALGGSGICSR